MKLNKSDFPSERLKPIGRISKKWKMPFGLDEHQLTTILTYTLGWVEPEDKCLEENCGCNHLVGIEEIIKYYDMLTALNPRLDEIYAPSPDDQWQVIFGAISRFNADDIESFLDGYNYSTMTEDEIQIVEDVQDKLGIDIGGYCPSPKTLKKMKKWLEKQE